MATSLRNSKGKEREMEESTGKPAQSSSILSHTMDQLVTNGFISKPFDASNLDTREAAKLERCLSTMLTKLSSSQQDLARMMDKHRSLASDLDRLEQGQSRNKHILEASEHEREQAKAKAVAATKDLSTEQAKHALAKDEIHKARLALSSVKSMALHDSKRRENEVASVLARWQKVSSISSSSSQHAASIVVNSQEKIGKNEMLASSRDNGRDTPSGMTLLEESLRRADDEKHLIQEENIHLREAMGDVMNEVRATLASIDVEMPPLQEELNDSFVQVSTPHFVLSPNELLDYLSKLLVTLRDATHSVIRASEVAVAEALANGNQQATERISELEASLAAMQAELDAARTETARITEMVDKEREERDAAFKHALEEANNERKEAKKVKSELKELRKSLESLQANNDADKKAWQQDRAKMKNLQAELESIKQSTTEHIAVSEPSSKRKRADPHINDSTDSTVEERPAKREARPVRQSITSAALKHILASSADTPPTKSSAPLTSKPVNSQAAARKSAVDKESTSKSTLVNGPSGAEHKETVEQALPSSAALAAKDRIQRAVEAAKARKGSLSQSDHVTQRRR